MSRSLACILCLLLLTTALHAQNPEAPQESKDLVGQLMREALAGELKNPFPFKEERFLDLGALGKKRIASVEGTIQFDDPKMNLTVEVGSMKRTAPDEVTLDVVAKCPMSGNATGDLIGVIRESAGCKAQAEVHITGTIKVVTMKDVIRCTPQITKLDGKISGLKFDRAWAKNEVNELTQKALNELIKNKQDDLKRDANKALEKAAANDRLKVKLSDLTK